MHVNPQAPPAFRKFRTDPQSAHAAEAANGSKGVPMKQLMRVTAALSMLALASAAQADLNRVGPAPVPAVQPQGIGFPAWYQDLNGLTLDICLPNADRPGPAAAERLPAARNSRRPPSQPTLRVPEELPGRDLLLPRRLGLAQHRPQRQQQGDPRAGARGRLRERRAPGRPADGLHAHPHHRRTSPPRHLDRHPPLRDRDLRRRRRHRRPRHLLLRGRRHRAGRLHRRALEPRGTVPPGRHRRRGTATSADDDQRRNLSLRWRGARAAHRQPVRDQLLRAVRSVRRP